MTKDKEGHYDTSITQLERVNVNILDPLEVKLKEMKAIKDQSTQIKSEIIKIRSKELKLAMAHLCNIMMFISAKNTEVYANLNHLLRSINIGEEIFKIHSS